MELDLGGRAERSVLLCLVHSDLCDELPRISVSDRAKTMEKEVMLPARGGDLSWTGERFVIGEVSGEVEFEHLHRYLFAVQFCAGVRVLDIACGEGFGAFILSQVARHVTAVDLDETTIDHARAKYRLGNVEFKQGACTDIPMPDASCDVVVSFETIEHFADHQTFLAEIKRVLVPGGLLVISTPDREIYSPPGKEPNPFHVRELSSAEFSQALAGAFRNVRLASQKAFSGSAILPKGSAVEAALEIFTRTGSVRVAANATLREAPYLIALASDLDIQPSRFGILDCGVPGNVDLEHVAIEFARRDSEISDLRKAAKLEIERLNAAIIELHGAYGREIERLRAENVELNAVSRDEFGRLAREMEQQRVTAAKEISRVVAELDAERLAAKAECERLNAVFAAERLSAANYIEELERQLGVRAAETSPASVVE